MNPDPWQQLVVTAKRAPRQPDNSMPFGFDTRVLAEWKSSLVRSEGVPWTAFLRGALVCSTVIMLLSLVVNYETARESEPTAVAIADSALRISLSP